MGRTVTQRDIASAAGVTQSAVSQALRGSKRIGADLRERILRVADELGYHKDPLVAGLARRRLASGTAPIAYLASRCADVDRYLAALRRRCDSEERVLHVIAAGRSGEDIGEELRERGVVGVLVGQNNRSAEAWSCAWDDIAVVHCGLYVAPGAGDVVAMDLFAAPEQAWQQLHEPTCAALLPLAGGDALSERFLLGALLALEQRVGDPTRFAVWSGDDINEGLAWLRARDHEHLLCYDPACLRQLRRAGEQRPATLLVMDEPQRGLRGLLVDFDAVVAEALRVLDDKLQSGRFGPGTSRRITMLPMPWYE